MNSAYQETLDDARRRGRSEDFRGVRHERFLLLDYSGKVSRWKHLLMAKSDFRCALCDGLLMQSEMDVDHVLPKSRGGSDEWSNLQATHYTCNRRKGNRV